MASVVSILSRKNHLLMKEIQSHLPKLPLHIVENPGTDEQFRKSNVIVADFDLVSPYLYELQNAKWVQGTWAGVEKLFTHLRTNQPPPLHVTRFSGKHFGTLMSEYVISNIINKERAFFEIRDNQKKAQWVTDGKIFEHRTFHELTIGIMGLGNIGKEIAKNLNYLGATVIGYGRKASFDAEGNNYVTEYYDKSNFSDFLRKCEYFINVLPSTIETQGLLNGTVLENCKDKNTVFINIGRGSIISEKCLVNALERKWLAGAILDVHEEEPLKTESLLWTMENVFITPHISGVSRAKDVAEHFVANFKLYEQNLPVKPLIDFSKGY